MPLNVCRPTRFLLSIVQTFMLILTFYFILEKPQVLLFPPPPDTHPSLRFFFFAFLIDLNVNRFYFTGTFPAGQTGFSPIVWSPLT